MLRRPSKSRLAVIPPQAEHRIPREPARHHTGRAGRDWVAVRRRPGTALRGLSWPKCRVDDRNAGPMAPSQVGALADARCIGKCMVLLLGVWAATQRR